MALLAKARQMKEAAEMTDFLAASGGDPGRAFSGAHSGHLPLTDMSTAAVAAARERAVGADAMPCLHRARTR
ncbi:hypothetical protein N2603_36335 [Bradyrhizobium huanghuaihaiense]|uniref:hypothetical protein n=1 Tax=Bradyrhizobium huanghuaihaiense TaxID=990078 RepID=UPI0021AA10E2|nr:hypothetical protein [Bradyrhizobium sp. CB3035]UWU75452.1 hypothetical protein N2603_36335 [Bradyrhizobium sp. CB3035]